jgi:m7GpppX diphosphatase
LKGEEGAKLCEEMRDELRKAAHAVYGVPPSKLRIFFHYHPQFYRLHAHCVPINYVAPGSEVERAHLLTTVAENLRMKELYYAEATLSYKVRVGEKLHGVLLQNNGKGLV